MELTLTIAGLLALFRRYGIAAATAADRTEEVELDHLDPHIVGRLLESAVMCVAAGHVDHDIDSSEAGSCIGECALDRGLIGHIQPDSCGALLPSGQTCRYLFRCGLIKVGHRDLRAFLGQPGTTGPADTVRSTGDDQPFPS